MQVIFLLSFCRFLLKIPLYNKIRQLKRKLQAAQGKVEKSPPAKKQKTDKNKENRPIDEQSQADIHVHVHQEPQSDILLAEPNAEQVHIQQEENAQEPRVMPTPQKLAEQCLRKDEISPVKAPTVLKELVALNSLAKQISKAPVKTKMDLLSKKDKKSHPRCATLLSKKIGLDRHNVFNRNRQSRRRKRNQDARRKEVVVRKMQPYMEFRNTL